MMEDTTLSDYLNWITSLLALDSQTWLNADTRLGFYLIYFILNQHRRFKNLNLDVCWSNGLNCYFNDLIQSLVLFIIIVIVVPLCRLHSLLSALLDNE